MPSYHNQPKYELINHFATTWTQSRYRVLQSSLSQLIYLRDSSDTTEMGEQYNHAIKLVQTEIKHILKDCPRINH